MTNNEGVVNCDDYVGKPSYCPYYRIEYVYRPQWGANPRPTPI